MKNLLLILMAAVLLSCSEDAIIEQSQNTETNLMLSAPDPALDDLPIGLYRGIVATYDLSVHGEIVISIKNDGSLRAQAELLDGTNMQFEGIQLSTSEFSFKGARGVFQFRLDDSKKIKIHDAIFDNQDGAVVAYKEMLGGGITVAFGTYADDVDPTFFGTWDMINFGALEGSVGGQIIDDVVITESGGAVYTDADTGNFEPFTPCILFPANEPYVLLGPPNSFINAKDQQSSFNGSVCNWSLQYATNSTATVYFDDDTCSNAAPSGTWAWRSRTGSITVISPMG